MSLISGLVLAISAAVSGPSLTPVDEPVLAPQKTAAVRVIVRNRGHKSIPNAQVRLFDMLGRPLTRWLPCPAQGRFFRGLACKTRYRVRARAPGFKTRTKRFKTRCGRPNPVPVTLRR